jgi:hypothetical protein
MRTPFKTLCLMLQASLLSFNETYSRSKTRTINALSGISHLYSILECVEIKANEDDSAEFDTLHKERELNLNNYFRGRRT